MTLYRKSLRDAAKTALIGAATAAGAKVFTSRGKPVAGGQSPSKMPALLIYTPEETKRNIAEAGTEKAFRTTAALVVEVVIEDKDHDAAELALDGLCESVENVLLADATFVRAYERCDSVETRDASIDVEGELFTGRAWIIFSFSNSERFQPVFSQAFGGLNLYIDALNVFDPEGTYTPPFAYPVTPAPRTEGPEGRPETEAKIDVT